MTKKTTYFALRSYLNYLRGSWLKVSLTTVFFALSAAAIAVIPFFVGRLIDTINGPQPTDVWIFVWLLIAASTGHHIFWRLGEFSYLRLLQRKHYTIETAYYKHIIQKSYPYFIPKFSGKIGSYTTQLANEVRGLADSFFWTYIDQFFGLAALMIIFASVNWQTAAVFAVGLLLMVAVGRLSIGKLTAATEVETDVSSTKNAYLFDSFVNFSAVKSFLTEKRETNFIATQQELVINAARRRYSWSMIFWTSMTLIVRDMLWPTTIILNVWLFLQGAITIGELTTILSAIIIFSQTIWGTIWQFTELRLRFARMEEAHHYLFSNEVLFSKAETGAQETLSSSISTLHNLELRHLSFSYPDKQNVTVLNDISIHLNAGEKVGIVGKSGSGKSTLVSLLLNHYQPTNGEILLNGQTVNVDELAKNISYVPQDTALFHRTIGENITYAIEGEVPDATIMNIAKQAQAHEFIMELSDGYETLVGERGVKLSGGQRQRVAIARAMLKNAPILVLDEATSALDSENELLVQKALNNLWQNKTAIVIAHRLSTIAKLDRIIVLDNGRIAEDGSHTELLKLGGTYAKLWNHQSGGFIEE